jgi:hypothetical protein
VPIDVQKAFDHIKGRLKLAVRRFVQGNFHGLEGLNTPILKPSTTSALHKPVGSGPHRWFEHPGFRGRKLER